MSRLLAVDYGLKRIGIAVTDPEQIIASPLTTVSPQEFIPFLKKYFEQENVSTVVMGFPTDVDAKKDIVVEIKKMYQVLLTTFPEKKIELYDERYTSKIAFYALRNFDKKIKTQKENLDKMSAAVLLESYMNSLKFKKI
jgi:putative Holliday junction resolvase